MMASNTLFFVDDALKNEKIITIREGRCQKIIDKSGREIFSQKGVDSWFVMDLCNFKDAYPDIKKIILIACDSDFVPTIKLLISKGFEIILYTYYEKKRESLFSTSNRLLNAVSRYVKLSKQNFLNLSLRGNKT